MSDKHWCPRGAGPESPFKAPFNGEAEWHQDSICSYCGSLHPDVLISRLEAGDVELGPTDKSYKVYVKNAGGEQLPAMKFYFDHFSAEQQNRFLELLNACSLKVGFPGHFYVLPFFLKPAAVPRVAGDD